MNIPGIFGTRADLLMDVILVAILALPSVIYFSMKKARQRDHVTHKKIQIGSFVVVMAAVVLFEINIQTRGGSGSLVAASPVATDSAFLLLLYTHISIAVLTFLAWAGLMILSLKAYDKKKLPGQWSRLHKRVGLFIFSGTTLTAFTGAAVYYFSFVL